MKSYSKSSLNANIFLCLKDYKREFIVSIYHLLNMLAREEDIRKIKDRMDNQYKIKDREFLNTQEKIQLSAKELKQLQKKSGMSESEKIVELERKIIGVELKNKELQKEIKYLKKLQHDQGNELVGLDISDQYPEKIKSLLEEVRWAKDKNVELNERVEAEEKQVKRQKEHLLNLEENKKDLETKYRRQVRTMVSIRYIRVQGVITEKNEKIEYMDVDQVQLLNRIMQLENDLQSKDKVYSQFQ